ncbi:MAG: iron ABC transporter permease, partial [Chloroflexi bacterium]|nr:iron ABC transporter permease [Chloroflexota bacterium]
PSGLWRAATSSVLVSGAAAAVAAVAAVPVAILVARYSGLVIARVVEVLSYTGYALPGLVVALALVFAAIRVDWLYQSHTLLVAAYALLFLPQAVGATRVALLQVRPSMEDAARSLGRGSWSVLTSITIPLAARGVLAGAALVFLTTIKELPATLLLAPPGFQTLATRVWSTTADARYAEAAVPAVMLIAVSGLAVVLLQPAARR